MEDVLHPACNYNYTAKCHLASSIQSPPAAMLMSATTTRSLPLLSGGTTTMFSIIHRRFLHSRSISRLSSGQKHFVPSTSTANRSQRDHGDRAMATAIALPYDCGINTSHSHSHLSIYDGVRWRRDFSSPTIPVDGETSSLNQVRISTGSSAIQRILR